MDTTSSPAPPAELPVTQDAANSAVADRPRAGAASRPPTIGEHLHLNRYRIDGWTPTKVAVFISVLGETGSVTRAAEYVSITTASAYRLRARPGAEPFAEAWEAAIGSRHERLADIAMQRITEGTERTRWWRGQQVGSERVYSDRLLMFMLAATSPDRARPHPPGPTAAARAQAAAVSAPVPGDVLGLLSYGAPTACIGPAADGDAACAGDCPEGRCAACDTPQPTAKEVYDAALAEEYALPPEVEATMLAQREKRAAAKAATDAELAQIDADIEAAKRLGPTGNGRA